MKPNEKIAENLTNQAIEQLQTIRQKEYRLSSTWINRAFVGRYFGLTKQLQAISDTHSHRSAKVNDILRSVGKESFAEPAKEAPFNAQKIQRLESEIVKTLNAEKDKALAKQLKPILETLGKARVALNGPSQLLTDGSEFKPEVKQGKLSKFKEKVKGFKTKVITKAAHLGQALFVVGKFKKTGLLPQSMVQQIKSAITPRSKR